MKNPKKEWAKNPVLRMFKEGRKKGPVCSSPLVTITLEQMKNSGYYYPTAHTDPQPMSKLASTAYTLIGFQGIRIPFDLCVEGEAFGCKIREGGKESPPSILEKAFEEKETFSVPEYIFQKGRFQVVFEALKELKKRFGNETIIYAGIAGPLTLVGSLYDASIVMRWPIKDPQRMDDNLKVAAGFQVEYADRLFESGADVLVLIDPTASGDLLSRKHFQRHLIPIYQQLRERIHRPIILHICGYTVDFLDLLPETGFEAFSFEGPTVAVTTAREKTGEKMLLVGNIPTYDVLLYGTPEKIHQESLKALKDGIDMLAPSCGVPVQTPIENLKSMVRAFEDFKEGWISH